MLKNIFSKNRRGFTLLELMVAMGIFSVVMLIATDGFIVSLRTERQSANFSFINSNLSTVIEQMAKEIRTGRDFCTNGVSCASLSQLSFVNAYNETITYCLKNASIKKNIEVDKNNIGADCSSGQEITGENVSVQYLNFRISGQENNDGFPPRVTIRIGANSKNKSASFYVVNFQTTVSSRVIGG